MITPRPSIHYLRRQILPSRSLAAYVAQLFFARFLLILTLLVVILQSLDLLNRSEEILAADGATRAAFLRYIQLRSPELLSQFIPFSSLLAALFSLSSLNQSSEITVMRAGGLSAAQILAPFLLVSCVIALLHFIFHDRITVKASEELAFWRQNDYALDIGTPPTGQKNIWLTDGAAILEAESASFAADRAILNNINIYERDSEGLLKHTLTADLAVHAPADRPGGDFDWMLYGLREFDLDRLDFTREKAMSWHFEVPLEQIFSHIDNPGHVTLSRLTASIAALKAAGLDTSNLQAAYYARFSKVIASLIMPILALFVAFAPPRGSARLARVVIGMGVGFVYFVFENYMTAMGSLGVVPPLLSAFAPATIFSLSASAVLMHQR